MAEKHLKIIQEKFNGGKAFKNNPRGVV